MHDDLDQVVLTLGGREVPGAGDRIRRYCGLAWSGGGPETWAYRYYDAIESDPDRLEPVDVLVAGALHPTLGRNDLAYFWDQRNTIEKWLRGIPLDVALADANDPTLDKVTGIATPAAASLALMTKVLHRKRPALIPLVDREILDWYRPITGERAAVAAWPGLLRALRHDLTINAEVLAAIANELEDRIGRRLSHLRLVDITIWMGSRP